MATMMEDTLDPCVLNGSRLVGRRGLKRLPSGWQGLRCFGEELHITIQCPQSQAAALQGTLDRDTDPWRMGCLMSAPKDF